MSAGRFNHVFTRRSERAGLVVVGLAVVSARPVLERRHVEADLHRFGAREIFAVAHDAVEELGAKPVEELAKHLRDDDRVDVVQVKHKQCARQKARDIPWRRLRALFRGRWTEPALAGWLGGFALRLEEPPFILEMDVLEPGDCLVVEHGLVQHTVHASFRVADDEDEDLVDELRQLLLEVDGGADKAHILLQVVQKEGRIGDPKCEDCHVPLVALDDVVDFLHSREEQAGEELGGGVVVGIAGREEENIGRHGLLGGGPLWEHVGDYDVEEPVELMILEDKHLIIEATIPDKFLALLLFLFLRHLCGGGLIRRAGTGYPAERKGGGVGRDSLPAVRRVPGWTGLLPN